MGQLPTPEWVSLVEEIGSNAEMLLFMMGRGDVFEENPDLGKRVIKQLVQSPERYYYGFAGPSKISREAATLCM
jgi:hypothetical protein